MSLHVLEHPLADHILALLRDTNTGAAQFRTLSTQITTLLVVEATRDIQVRTVDVETPMERAECRKLAVPFATIAIVRAGMSMIDAVVSLLPSVSVGFVGMERDEETAEARSYYCKLPPLDGKRVLLVDPMLATGGSALQALDLIYANGAGEVSFLNIVAAPEGVGKIDERFPDVAIYTAALDRELNDRKYILPGLGDFGDRLYGT